MNNKKKARTRVEADARVNANRPLDFITGLFLMLTLTGVLPMAIAGQLLILAGVAV